MSASLTDTDGSETLSVIISGITTGVRIFDDQGTELIPFDDEVTITDPARLAALDQFSILPPSGDSADITLTVTATATEAANGDQAVAVQSFNIVVGEPAPAIWQNTSQDDSWHNDLNWSTILVPQDGEDATLADVTGVISYTTGTTAIVDLTASEDLSVDGGTLTVSGIGTFDGTSTLTLNGGSFGGTGTITVADQFQFTSGTLTGSGGTMTVTGSTTIAAGSKTIDKDLTLAGTTTATNAFLSGLGVLTNQGTWTVTDGSITNTIDNEGSITAEGSNAVTGSFTNAIGSTLTVEAGLVGDAGLTILNGFTNAGTIVLDDLTVHNATLTVSSGTLINTGTIQTQDTDQGGGGTGTRSIQAELDNQGTVTIDTAADINKASAAHLNSGLIDVNDDLIVAQSGTTPTFTSSGTIDIAAGKTITVSGGTFTNDVNGTIKGGGTLDVSGAVFISNGTLSPGASAGTLTVIGTFEQSKTAFIEIELEGEIAGAEYDVLKVDGTVTLGGTLDVSLINGFTPITGNMFQIIDATAIDAAVLGDFATIDGLDIGGGLVLDAMFSLTAVKLNGNRRHHIRQRGQRYPKRWWWRRRHGRRRGR